LNSEVNKVIFDLGSVVVIFTLMGITVYADSITLRAIPALLILVTAIYLRAKTDKQDYKTEKMDELLNYSRNATFNFTAMDKHGGSINIKSELGEDRYNDILEKVGLVAVFGNDKQRTEALRIYAILANGQEGIRQEYLTLMKINMLKGKIGL